MGRRQRKNAKTARFNRETFEQVVARLDAEYDLPPLRLSQKSSRQRGLRRSGQSKRRREYTPAERLILLDIWTRSGLPVEKFCRIADVGKDTLRSWLQRLSEEGSNGIFPMKRGAPTGSRLPEEVKRAILLLKEGNPEFGCRRIRDTLYRAQGIKVSQGAIDHFLRDQGYEVVDSPRKVHRDRIRRFERARPMQMWQSDLFTFLLKRENRRVWLVGFLDDHSRLLLITKRDPPNDHETCPPWGGPWKRRSP